MEVNGLQSQTDYMMSVVDKCRANKMAGRLSTSLADRVASTIERHDKLRANIDDTLSQIERAQSNVDDFEVSCLTDAVYRLQGCNVEVSCLTDAMYRLQGCHVEVSCLTDDMYRLQGCNVEVSRLTDDMYRLPGCNVS